MQNTEQKITFQIVFFIFCIHITFYIADSVSACAQWFVCQQFFFHYIERKIMHTYKTGKHYYYGNDEYSGWIRLVSVNRDFSFTFLSCKYLAEHERPKFEDIQGESEERLAVSNALKCIDI